MRGDTLLSHWYAGEHQLIDEVLVDGAQFWVFKDPDNLLANCKWLGKELMLKSCHSRAAPLW